MSDALTDIARDEARGEYFSKYAKALLDYVKGEVALDTVVRAAELVDGVPNGYWSGRTKFSDEAKDFAEKLKANDPGTWAQMVFNLKDSWTNWGLYKEYRKLAPFSADAQILYVDFSDNWDDKIKPMFAGVMKELGLCTEQDNGGDRYLMVLDPKVLKKIAKTAIWMGFRTTSWTPGEKREKPTTPFRKDRDYSFKREK